MTEKKRILIWWTNNNGKMGVKVDIVLNIFPTVILGDNIVQLDAFAPTMHLFIKEFRLAYTTEELISYLEDTIESYMSNIYPESSYATREKAAETLAPHLIDFLTPYIEHVRECGVTEPPEEKSSLSAVDQILKESYLPGLKEQLSADLNTSIWGDGGNPTTLVAKPASHHAPGSGFDLSMDAHIKAHQHYYDLLKESYDNIPKTIASKLPKGDES
jgi:hypothetical protein